VNPTASTFNNNNNNNNR